MAIAPTGRLPRHRASKSPRLPRRTLPLPPTTHGPAYRLHPGDVLCEPDRIPDRTRSTAQRGPVAPVRHAEAFGVMAAHDTAVAAPRLACARPSAIGELDHGSGLGL